LGQFRAMSGILVEYRGLERKPDHWIEPEAEVHLFRIIQEAMTNARKHARASRILVALSASDACLTVTIEDDGRGFEEADAACGASHYGLRIIRERAAEANAACDIVSVPGQGTRVTVKTSLKAAS
jgi:two-component system, NarL family, nitrate/nitrite sensor histidine kinase NarX